MPKGKKKKVAPVVSPPPETKKVEAPKVAESPKRVLPSFDPAFERLFEAPDGAILVGAKDRETVLYRQGNGGKGQMIQPMR